MRKRHNFNDLGYEYGISDLNKTEEIVKLLSETRQLEEQIDRE